MSNIYIIAISKHLRLDVPTITPIRGRSTSRKDSEGKK